MLVTRDVCTRLLHWSTLYIGFATGTNRGQSTTFRCIKMKKIIFLPLEEQYTNSLNEAYYEINFIKKSPHQTIYDDYINLYMAWSSQKPLLQYFCYISRKMRYYDQLVLNVPYSSTSITLFERNTLIYSSVLCLVKVTSFIAG